MPTPNISLKQLRVLQAVAEHGGFGRAGEAIGLSQPAVSQCIRTLEAQLGLKLLDRTTREVVLTPAGQSLLQPLGRLLGELDELLERTRALGVATRGVVRLASAPTISAGLMPRCLAAARRAYPDIELRLTDQAQQLAVDSVRSGAVDFAVVVGFPPVDDLVQQAIFDERFMLICPPGHALAARRRLTLKALAGLPLVLLDQTSGSRPLIDRALQQAGVAARVVLDVGHATTAFRMVAEGLGLSVLPALSLPWPAGLTLQAVPLQGLRRQIVLVQRRRRSLSPAARRVWDLVAEVARPEPEPGPQQAPQSARKRSASSAQ